MTRYFVIGLILGAVVVSLFLFLLATAVRGIFPEDVRAIMAVGSLGSLAAMQIAGKGHQLPQNRRLVPAEISLAPSWDGAFQFGFELGTGLRTYVTTALPLIAVLSLLFLSDAIVDAVGLGLGFALGRAVLLPIRDFGGGETWDLALEKSSYSFGVLLLVSAAMLPGSLVL